MTSDSLIRSSVAMQHFGRVLTETGHRGPVGEILIHLADGSLTVDAFDRIVEAHGVRREEWFRGQILDLMLGLVRSVLETSRLTPDHRALFQALRRQLSIPDGELMARRPAEVGAVVDEQLDRILDDGIINGAEELEQVELQVVFGLAYDDYLLVSRRAFERVHAELTYLARHDAVAAGKLRVLEPMYLLVTSRARTLGALF